MMSADENETPSFPSENSVKSSVLQHLQSYKYGIKNATEDVNKLKKIKSTAQTDTSPSHDFLRINSTPPQDQGSFASVEETPVNHNRVNVPCLTPKSEHLTVLSSEAKEASEMDSKIEELRSNIIRPINRDVVHQICSGQVIVTLCTAVKELVENSLDAGATKIDIRLVEYGSKLIEVSDDASGIEETNFEGLALKHHTSKIADFEDLGTLSTFGFRGEALSSLCALANLTVTTRHKDSERKSGHRIEYNYKGEIMSKVKCAREYGTTITLKDLFHTLPVRHKEFNKNLKKEYHRMINVLYGYCLVVDGVRITCTNQLEKGSAQKVFSVPAYNSMRERIVTLFGSKQLSLLVEIKQTDEVSEEIMAEFGLQTYEKKYDLHGYISKPNHGRSSSDRQFYFINSRPCDPVKISRIVNEVYHTFSRQQNPFVCLHIQTNRENVDVNVTPDKRTLYVQNEKILLASLKASLIPLLASAASSFDTTLSSSQIQSTLSFDQSSQNEIEQSSLCLSSSLKIRAGFSKTNEPAYGSSTGFDSQYSTSYKELPKGVAAKTTAFIQSFCRGSSSEVKQHNSKSWSSFKREREEGISESSLKQAKLSRFGTSAHNSSWKGSVGASVEIKLKDPGADLDGHLDDDIHEPMQSAEEEFSNDIENDEDEIVYDDDLDTNDCISQSSCVSVYVDWKTISQTLAQRAQESDRVESSSTYVRKFRAKISPQENRAAEDELQKQITQEMFSKMKIIGQFNLGFIIVKNGPDLFIVDQHASDEKYNYEDLEKHTVLNGQQLFSPLDLDLPAVSENIIMDNVEIFQRNGFFFIISPNEEPRKRVQLQKIPFSKNVQFGKSDVEELIFMLEDGSSGKAFYRPTKVRDMLASRACRKSVMIGTALSGKEMRSIIDHMGEMNQPWNCPHGRPTIRHLINLNLLPDLEATKYNH